MKILTVFASDYPWDVRIEKILKCFIEDGHDVTLLCRNTKGLVEEENLGGIRCRRFKNKFFGNNIFSTPAFFNPLWFSFLRKSITELQPDVLVVRDLPLAPLVAKLGKEAQIPVWVDMAENYPAMWRNAASNSKNRLLSLMVKNPHVAALMEKYVVKKSDITTVVIEEMRDYLLGVGARQSNISIISNTPEVEIEYPEPRIRPQSDETISLVYTGYLTRTRGVQQIIKAIPNLNRDIVFHIVGSGEYREELEQLVLKLGVSSKVLFHGWVNHADMERVIKLCDIGVVPHLKTEHTDTTIPNKLFDYMAYGLPVIVSNAAPLARIVKEINCGGVCDISHVDDVVDQINRLVCCEEFQQLSMNGLEAIAERYNWEYDKKNVLSVLNRLTR